GILVPLVERGTVDRRQLPLLERIDLAGGEAAALFLAADGEPVFDQRDAGADQHALDLRTLAHEFEVVVRRAETHHALHAGPVVPGAVEEYDLAGRGKLRDVTLEIPLRPFALGRFLQRNHTGRARVRVLHEALDGAALARRVPAFEQDDQTLAGLLDPALRLQQLALEFEHVRLVRRRAHRALVGILAGLEQMA